MQPTINAAYVTVKNLDRAIAFYEDIFETKIAKYDKRMTELRIDNFTLLLYDPKVDNWEPTKGDNVVLNIAVDGVDAFFPRIQEMGCTIIMPVTEIGPDKFFQAEDTEGNILEFYQVYA